MQNYKLNLKKEDLIDSKFDAREWTTEMKTLFQETLFEMGLGWSNGKTVQWVKSATYYFIGSSYLLWDDIDKVYSDDTSKEITFDEMFSLVQKEPLSEEFPLSEYHYTKCTFTKASEALKAWEEGEELYRKISDFVYYLIENDVNLCVSYVEDTIYYKVVTPWYETVCEDKPIYITTEQTPLLKMDKIFSCPIEGYYLRNEEHNINRHVDDCVPLAPSQVDDIVQTMKLWEK